jgi:hypothetical protein
MAFHIQIESGQHEARVFNLEPGTVRDEIVAPWLAGRTVGLADRLWEPAHSTMTIIEGPVLPPHDLAHGQGWNNARRSGRDVTEAALRTVRESLAARGVAVLAAEPQDDAYVRAACERIGAIVVPWLDVRAALLDGGRVDSIVVLAVGDVAPTADGWFDAGLARGALGAATVVVHTGAGDVPAVLARGGLVRLDAGDQPFATAIEAARAACARRGDSQ